MAHVRSSVRWPSAVTSVVLLTTLAFLPACSGGRKATTRSTSASSPISTRSTPVSTPSATAASPTVTSPGAAVRVALGTNNPAQGDCTTNTPEQATSVGFAVLKVTAGSFEASIQLQAGSANATYAVFMQQVPGSCPQARANGGTLTTDSTGRGHASTTVPRVSGATTFFVQLVPAGSGPSQYTSDRISGVH